MDAVSPSAAPPAGIPAPYGRACSNCSRAKCRCIYRQDGNGCERCYRLKKDCRPSTPVRRRASGKKSSSAMLSRTAQLEQKLDGLVSLLTAQTNSHLKEQRETKREGSAATNATDAAHSCGSDSAPESSTRGTPAASTGHADYSVESRNLSAVPNDFQPLVPNGPEFGCGMLPQAIPPLTARIASNMPRRSDAASAADRTCPTTGLGGSSMPRTPESSTSSTVPAPGGSRTQNKRQHCDPGPPLPQPQPQHTQPPDSHHLNTPNTQSTQNTQNGNGPGPGPGPHSTTHFGWGFSYFPNTPKTTRSAALGDAGLPSPDDPLNLDPAITPSPAEAEHSLHMFRTTMLPYFPFVLLPDGLTAQHLRDTRPYLWLAIMSVTYQRLPSNVQQARSTHLRALFAQRIVLEIEKSLDLLQSLLVFLTWIHYTSKRDRPTLSVMTQLAVSLVYDLGLHKFMAPCKSLIARLVRDHYQQSFGPGATTFSNSGAGTDDFPEPHSLSMEERRAALACYVLTSKFSLALKRCDTLKWTSRMEEHLSELSGKPENLQDHVLVTQVRLQRVTDYIHQGEWQNSDPNIASALSVDCTAIGNATIAGITEDNSRRLMPSFVSHIVRAKIDEIKDSIPPEIRHYYAVLDAVYSTDMVACAATVMPIIAPVLSMAAITVVAIRSANSRARPRAGANGVPLPTQSAPEQSHDESPNPNQDENQPQNPNQSQSQSQYQNQGNKQNGASKTTSSLASDFARVAALERCVESVAAFWAFFQQITSGSFAALPFSYFAHFTLCIVLLYGLSVIDEPNWDRAGVRDRLQVLSMLDGVIAKLGDAPRVAPTVMNAQEGFDVFSRAATMLSSVRDLWAADLGRLQQRDREERSQSRRNHIHNHNQDSRMAPPASAPVPVAQMPLPTGHPGHPGQRMVPQDMDMPPLPGEAPAWPMQPMPGSSVGPVSMPVMAPANGVEAGDTAMGDAPPPATPQDPSLLLGQDGFVPDLFSVMGLSEDYMFWDLFLPGGDGTPQI